LKDDADLWATGGSRTPDERDLPSRWRQQSGHEA
jgi:hypothetical protein